MGLAVAVLAAGMVPVPVAPQPCVYVARGTEFTAGQLPVAVNALGYDPERDLYYAIAGSEVATITRDGVLTVRGPAPVGLRGAHVGTISGGEWLLLSGGGELVAVDLETLAVKRRVVLSVEPRIGDWDAWRGALFGLDTDGQGGPRLARVDPGTGRVSLSEQLDGLPGDGSYGGVVVDPAGTMHALHNLSGRLLHLPLGAPETATVTDFGPPAGSSDAAPCPRELPPQEPPAPEPEPEPVPRPALPQAPQPSPSESPIPTPSASPVSTRKSVAAAMMPPAPWVPDRTRVLFFGLLLPALAAVALGAARRG